MYILILDYFYFLYRDMNVEKTISMKVLAFDTNERTEMTVSLIILLIVQERDLCGKCLSYLQAVQKLHHGLLNQQINNNTHTHKLRPQLLLVHHCV